MKVDNTAMNLRQDSRRKPVFSGIQMQHHLHKQLWERVKLSPEVYMQMQDAVLSPPWT